jgi:putative membrane-bound dehydrogenase-like protein
VSMKSVLLAAAAGLALGAAAQESADIQFKTAEGFQLETVLREPEVRQPLCMNFDERGRLWITQYLQFPFPEGLKVIGHDEYWRIQYENFPPVAPPNHMKGKDKVTIHEDTNGDGSFETVKEFVSGLSVTTSALPGRGGVWILNPPYLLFYADANRDDVPDGDPVVHLAGFGLEDLHAVANGLTWGADGWIYGYQGSTSTATITQPGIDKPPVHFKGQNLWRYNPADKRFEIFAEGGHNNFGIALDAQGRMFTGGNGGVIGYHQVQGGYYWKGWAKHGELTNPYAYGWFENMEDHSSKAKLSQGMVSYLAPNFPPQYQNALFTARALVHFVSAAELKPMGSTYSAHETTKLFETDDAHFQPVGMTQGPDGALYVADWHDSNITWSVSAETDRIMRETGRIYRVSYGANTPYAPFDLGAAATTELVQHLDHPNKWYRETALRVLYDRKDASAVPPIEAEFWEPNVVEERSLRLLWAINACGGFTPDFAVRALDHPNPLVREWTVRLLGNDGTASELIGRKLVAMGQVETEPHLRSQLASTAKRLSPEYGLPVVLTMLRSGKDVQDLHIPLLLWWAVEGQLRQDRAAVLAWVKEAGDADSAIFDNTIVPRLGQRFTQDRNDDDFNACADVLASLEQPAQRQQLLTGMATGLGQGTNAVVPEALNTKLADMLDEDPGNTQLLIIAARLGNKQVFDLATATIADASADAGQRKALMKLLGEEAYAPAKEPLLALFNEGGAFREDALAALQQFGDPEIGAALLAALPAAGDLKAKIASALVARKAWATMLLDAVDTGKIPPADVARDLLANLAALNDPAIDALVGKHWGAIRTSPAEKMAQVNAAWATWKNGPGNARNGIKVFENICGKCHVHLGIGRKVGPDLTGLNRQDLWAFITNVIDPSMSILPEYTGTTFTILGEDDGLGAEERVVNGFLLRETDAEISLVDSAGNEMTLPLDKVKSKEPMKLSVMPEGLLNGMSDQDIRDLFNFIQADTLPDE